MEPLEPHEPRYGFSDAEWKQIEIFRRMTPEQRVDCALRWTAFTLEVARAGIRYDHPDWPPDKVERELGRRITGIDVEKLPTFKGRERLMVVPDELATPANST